MPLSDLYLDANLGSYHWDRGANMNERNPGLGLERDTGDWRQMLGMYKNSLGKPSGYAMLGYTPLQYQTALGELKLGGLAGALSGYEMPVVPALGLLASLQRGRLGLNFIATPSAKMGDKRALGFAGLQARYRLGRK